MGCTPMISLTRGGSTLQGREDSRMAVHGHAKQRRMWETRWLLTMQFQAAQHAAQAMLPARRHGPQ